MNKSCNHCQDTARADGPGWYGRLEHNHVIGHNVVSQGIVQVECGPGEDELQRAFAVARKLANTHRGQNFEVITTSCNGEQQSSGLFWIAL